MTLLGQVRLIAVLNNNELFGQEKANIQVLESVRAGGANVIVGVNAQESGGMVGRELRNRAFETFDIPLGFQWSKQFFAKRPTLVLKNLSYVARASRVLWQQIRSFGATHLHLGNPLVYSFVAPALMMDRLKLVYRMGDEPPVDSTPNLWIWKRCARRSCRIVANSKFVRASILSAMPRLEDKVSLIYNTAPLASHSSRNAAAEVENCPLFPTITFAGQIAEHKGVHHFIDAAIQLAKDRTEVQFEIVGGSIHTTGFQQSLQDRIDASGVGQRIKMLGRVESMFEVFERSHLLVVPSLFEEPAANVVLEAKSQGVPSLVYPSGGLPELITEGKTGWICREKTVAGLVSSLREVLSLMTQHSYKEECLREYELRFGLKVFEQQWQALYQSTL